MNTEAFGESAYITPELVKLSTTKKVYIAGDAKIVQGKFGDKLELPVEIDNKPKTWGLNRDHVKSLQQFGKDSKTWLGKWVELRVVNNGQKEIIVAIPIITPSEVVA